MVSRTLALALALTSVVSAAPALQARQSDDCQATYKSCIAAGTPEVACSCTLTACLGEDSARNREYCSSATATPTSAQTSSSGYACNPAHSYPNGASCVSTNGALSLVTSTAAASTTTYACNPAHSYPNGASCVSTNGALSLVTSTVAASTTGYACNPAHSYPNGASCVSTNGALSLVTPAPSSAVSSAASSVVSSAVAAAATSGSGVAPGSNPVKVDGKTWNVNNLIRYCGEDDSGCDYNFAIVADGKTENCTVVRMPGSNAATESWSNQNCTDGSDIKVSWGYVAEPAPAFAVLTVVDNKELAWFGVSNINGQEVTASNPFGSGNFGNLAPEQVYTYN